MIFRDLCSFNLAMLGKHIWRVLHFRNSLLSRFLKTKYYSSCDILDAVPKRNSSLPWKIICSTMELVRSGIRWRVGNGHDIDI